MSTTTGCDARAVPAKPFCTLPADRAGDWFRALIFIASFLADAGAPGIGTLFWGRAYAARDYTKILAIAREYVDLQVAPREQRTPPLFDRGAGPARLLGEAMELQP